MKEWASKQWQAAMVWKLAFARAALYSLVTLGSAWLSAMNNVDFGLLSFWERVSTLVGIFVAWGTVMIAFLDKTSHNISAGRSPLSEGNTDQLRNMKENG